MSKKTKFDKVIGRTDYVVRRAINRKKLPPYKEEVTYLDFTSRN